MEKDEKTILQNSSFAENEERVESVQAQQPVEEKNDSWKYVTIGGATGILIGAGALYAANAYAAPAEVDDESNGDGDVAVAETSSDGQSFSAAFAAARAEVGAGGVFEWHGKLYNTFYAEEWKAMSPAERSDFVQRALEQHPVESHHAPTAVHPVEEPASVEEPVVLGKAEDPEEEPLLAAKHAPSDEDPDENSDVHVVNLPGGETGRATTMLVGGDDIQVIDTDGDGIADYSIDQTGEVVNLHNGQVLTEEETDDVIGLHNVPENSPFDETVDDTTEPMHLHEASDGVCGEDIDDFQDLTFEQEEDPSMDIIV